MPMSDLQELLKHELGDLLFAEKTILKGLKKMSREVSNAEMRQRIEAHQGETEQQIQNIERAFESLGLKAKAQKCPGILGIIQEHEEFKSDEEPSKPILEAFDLGSGLRIEHYEIAAYRSAIALARALRAREVVDLLKQNLEQEVAMAKFIETASAASLQQVQGMIAEQGAGGGARKRAGDRAVPTKVARGADASNGASNGASGGGRKTASKTASKAAGKTAAKSAAKRGGTRGAGAAGGDTGDAEVEQGRDD